MGRDIFSWIRLLRVPANLTLNISRDEASATSLGNLFQYFTTLIVKKFFLQGFLEAVTQDLAQALSAVPLG